MNSNFVGIKVSWNLHNEIQVLKSIDAEQFLFTCFPFIDDSDNSFKTSLSRSLPIENIYRWNWLSCSVNLSAGSKRIVLTTNTQKDVYSLTNSKLLFPNLNLNFTELKLQDLTSTVNWGVLFFRQIRLWNDSIESYPYVGRLAILNNNVFKNLLHVFDPLYNPTNPADSSANQQQYLIDLVGLASTQPVTYKVPYVANVIKDSEYRKLNLCGNCSKSDPKVECNSTDVSYMAYPSSYNLFTIESNDCLGIYTQ